MENIETMNENEYLDQRIQDQINWYDKKSGYNQKWYKRLRLLEIISATFIPFLAGYLSETTICLKVIIGFLGVVVAVLTGIISIYQFQENWIKYRTTAETLKHEKYLFLTKVEPYDTDNSFSILVKRIEAIISKENSEWAKSVQQKKEIKPNK